MVDVRGRQYSDFVMALGAVALGYGHPAVVDAVRRAAASGIVGPVAPELEEVVAADLAALFPSHRSWRFLKTGAEAVAAAVRLARVSTGRERVLTCGYHGWLDWSQGMGMAGVPRADAAMSSPMGFNDPDAGRVAIRTTAEQLAAVVLEPVIHTEPSAEWLAVVREETRRVGARLIFDEVKTACRVAPGGAVERWGGEPDLVVVGKAIANGMPLAAVGGSDEAMEGIGKTWISSTLATEFVSLAAAHATIGTIRSGDVTQALARSGARLREGMELLAEKHPAIVRKVTGIPVMCAFEWVDDDVGARVALECARRGLIFKRTPWNFVSLAHTDAVIDKALGVLGEAVASAE
jgi:glutamate-1-semialdehyde aminotransferase